jgi:hypothetical protein
MSDLLTRFEFEQLWLKNILINSRYLPPAGTPGEAATLTPFPGALAGRPGLLVSAGPSLRESLDTIRRLQERAFVLACDTALKPLLAAGIRPHAVITLDAQRHTLFALQGADLSETLVFADLVTNPTVLRCVAGHARALIFSTTARVSYEADGTISRESTPGTAHAENIHGPVGYIQSGGSVATSGFDLLRTLGCDPIMLIGQDLAYTGRRIHTSGTHHQERWVPGVHRTRSLEHIVESVVRRRKTHPVPAIRRGVPQNLEPEAAAQSATQLGDYVLNLYRLWFEQSIPTVSNRVANLTHAGAHIAGAEHPADVEAFVETLPKIDDPRAAFTHAGRPRVYPHPLNNRLYRDLRDTLARTDAATDPIAEFLEHYDYLRPLLRRSEVYVKRNRERLGEERARQLARRNTLEALQSLERSLRPYFKAPDPR